MRRLIPRLLIATSVLLVAPPTVNAAASSAAPTAAPATSATELQSAIDGTLSRTTGGRQISPYEIAWNDGETILSFPLPGTLAAPPLSPAAKALLGIDPRDDAGPDDESSCPWHPFIRHYCFYEHANFAGRRLQSTLVQCGASLIRMSVFDFNNITTAWVNHRHNRITVYDGSYGPPLLWIEDYATTQGNVGTPNNDRASSYKVCPL